MIYSLTYRFKSGNNKDKTLKEVMDNNFKDVCNMMRHKNFELDKEAMCYYLERVQDIKDLGHKKSVRKVYTGKRY